MLQSQSPVQTPQQAPQQAPTAVQGSPDLSWTSILDAQLQDLLGNRRISDLLPQGLLPEDPSTEPATTSSPESAPADGGWGSPEDLLTEILEDALALDPASAVSALAGLSLQTLQKVLPRMPASLGDAVCASSDPAFLYLAYQGLDLGWPVGVGFAVTGKLGATFGIPIFYDEEVSEELLRSTSSTLRLTRQGKAQVGTDVGYGVEVGVQAGSDRLDAGAKAEVKAGPSMMIREIYEFPIDSIPAMVACAIRSAVLDITRPGEWVERFLAVISGVSANDYLTEQTFESLDQTAATGEAGLGRGTAPGESPATGASPLPEALLQAGFTLTAGIGLRLKKAGEGEFLRGQIYVSESVDVDGGVRVSFLKLIQKYFGPVDVDLGGQVGVDFVIRSDGSLDLLDYTATVTDHGQGTGTSVTSTWSDTAPVDGVGDETTGLDSLIPDSLAITRRAGLGTSFANAFAQRDQAVAAKTREMQADSVLVSMSGTLTVGYTLDKALLLEAARWMRLESRPQDAGRLWTAFNRYLLTGSPDPELPESARIASLLGRASLTTALLRATISTGLGANASVADFYKIRAEASATVESILELDLKGSATTLAEVLQQAPDAFFTAGSTPEEMDPAFLSLHSSCLA